MGTFVTQTSTPTLFSAGDKSAASANARRPGWTDNNVLLAAEANALRDALLDMRTWARGLAYDARNYASINDAITAANAAGGGIVKVHGSAAQSGPIVGKDGVLLQGDGFENTILDFSSATLPDNDAIYATGTLTALPALASNIAKDGTSIVFASAPSVSAGDVLRIYNTADSSFSAARTYYRAGEFVKVLSVSGSTVTTVDPIWAAYTSGGTTAVHKVNHVRFGVDGVRIKLKSGVTGIRSTYGYQTRISNVRLTGTDVSHVTLTQCFSGLVTGVYIDDTTTVAAASYGITLENSQRIIVHGNEMASGRHALTVGGTVGPVNRELLVTGNSFSSYSANYSADCHGNTEHSTFRDNRCLNGLSVAGDFITVQNNDIKAMASNGIGILVYEALGPSFTIQGNRVRASADHSASTTTGLINAGGNNTTFEDATRGGTIKVVDNTLEFPGTYGGYAAYIGNLHAAVDFNVEFDRNTIWGESAPTADTRYALRLLGDGTTGHGFRKLSVKKNKCYRADFRFDKTAAALIEIDDNDVYDCPRDGVLMVRDTAYSATQAEQRILARRNTIIRPGKTGMVIHGDGDGSLSSALLEGNYIVNAAYAGTTGSSSTDSSVYATTLAKLDMEGNTFGKDDATSAQQRTFYADTITTLTERFNRNVGTLASGTASITNTRVGGYTYDATLKEMWGTAAPAAGAWTRGDVVWNSSPSTTTAPAILCTASGTPGTWVNWGAMGVRAGLTATATLNFPSIAAGGQQELTITVTGAGVGNAVILGPPAALEAGLSVTGYVSATNTVTVRLSNITAGAIDPASASWRAWVIF